MSMCYISCIPLNSAATACVLAGPWLCCHVGNPECRVVLVERIRASVVQRVPVLGRRQPQWKLAFAGRWCCNTSSHFLAPHYHTEVGKDSEESSRNAPSYPYMTLDVQRKFLPGFISTTATGITPHSHKRDFGDKPWQ